LPRPPRSPASPYPARVPTISNSSVALAQTRVLVTSEAEVVMANDSSQWVRVAALSDVPLGEAKAIRFGEGRSIALFNVDGRIYATDNQCPHMGYPLTRGAVRHGILTCDLPGRTV